MAASPPEPQREFALGPSDNARLANLCGPLDENLRLLETRLDVHIRRRGGTFRVSGAQAESAEDLLRELFPANSFYSQSPSVVHFGLGDASTVDRLTIRWPSGKVQELTGLAGNRHIVVDEGKDGPDAVETVVSGQTIAP